PAAARFEAAPSRAAEGRRRRVRANAATAHGARLDAAIAARDADALPSLFADESDAVDHTTGTTWDRQGGAFSYRALVSARDPICRHEPLATLGDALALSRVSMSASGFTGGTFDVGAYERVQIVLAEVDARGHRRRAEAFAVDRLGDAVARLYERYAELLPGGPTRDRGAATARSVAAGVGPPPPIDPRGATLAPAMEFVDHRPLGFPSASGAEANLRRIRSLFETAADVAFSVDDILALRADALLLRWTISGTDRAGGGGFERTYF